MPATEQTWRDSKLMHVVFGVSSLLMLLTTIWMLAADHRREWKDFQRRSAMWKRGRSESASQQQDNEQYEQELAAAQGELAADARAKFRRPSWSTNSTEIMVAAGRERRKVPPRTSRRSTRTTSNWSQQRKRPKPTKQRRISTPSRKHGLSWSATSNNSWPMPSSARAIPAAKRNSRRPNSTSCAASMKSALAMRCPNSSSTSSRNAVQEARDRSINSAAVVENAKIQRLELERVSGPDHGSGSPGPQSPRRAAGQARAA